jgi:hypothetical protein
MELGVRRSNFKNAVSIVQINVYRSCQGDPFGDLGGGGVPQVDNPAF